MKKILLSFMVAGIMAWSGTAFATVVSFSMTNMGSVDVSAIQAVVQDVSGGASITVDESGGPVVGDITGVFFDLDTEIEHLTASSMFGYDFGVRKRKMRRASLGGRLHRVGLAGGTRRGRAKYVGRRSGGTHVFPVPEPATIILMGAGLLGIAALTKRRLVG